MNIVQVIQNVIAVIDALGMREPLQALVIIGVTVSAVKMFMASRG